MTPRERRRRVLPSLGLALVFATALAPAASASSATATSTDVTYTAQAAEANDVSIAAVPGGLSITDPGAAITPLAGCAPVTANQVTCTAPRLESVSVSLADLNDRAVVQQSVALDFLSVVGGDGADVITVSGRVRQSGFLAGDGTSALPGPFDGNDVITGGPGRESMLSGGGNDIMRGGDGRDSVQSQAADGADFYSGGGDFDFISFQRANDVSASINGLADDGEGCPGPGCEGDNVQPDVEGIHTGSGDDVLIGSGGPNSLSSEAGNDTFSGGGGADAISGGEGDDSLSGDAGPDSLSGGEGSDRMNGGRGDDILLASGFGDDADVLAGGRGTDAVDYSDAVAGVRVDLDGRADDGVAGEQDNVRPDIEDIFGSRFRDVLRGGGAANDITGGRGADTLAGGKGPDGLAGGDGADRIVGGKGRDLLAGGGSADRITSRDGGPDEVLCGSALDRVKADRSDRIAADCDRVRRA